MISFKGEYEEALRVMRVVHRKLLLFLHNFGAIAYFFLRANCYGNRVQRGKNGNLLLMRGIVRMSQSLIWGGGGHVKFILTQPKSVSSDPSFRPWHLKHSHPIGKKYHCVVRYNTFTCYLQLSRKPHPCSSQCAKTN